MGLDARVPKRVVMIKVLPDFVSLSIAASFLVTESKYQIPKALDAEYLTWRRFCVEAPFHST